MGMVKHRFPVITGYKKKASLPHLIYKE